MVYFRQTRSSWIYKTPYAFAIGAGILIPYYILSPKLRKIAADQQKEQQNKRKAAIVVTTN